jgi:hypothetical protein
VVAARADSETLRRPDTDDADLVQHSPLMAVLHPDRIATIEQSVRLPFHTGFRK